MWTSRVGVNRICRPRVGIDWIWRPRVGVVLPRMGFERINVWRLGIWIWTH